MRSFEMRDKGNRTEYFLVFSSNHLAGLKVMKEAMWKVDPSGRFLFSDATNPLQMTLFQATPDYDLLKRMIVARFASTTEVAVEELELYVLKDTPFRETHYKNPILRPMERLGELTVLRSPRNRVGIYPEGTVLRFTTVGA